jgi:hypothetical protein
MIEPTSQHKPYNETPIPRYSYQKENINCIIKKHLLSPNDQAATTEICDDLEARKVHKQSKSKRLD